MQNKKSDWNLIRQNYNRKTIFVSHAQVQYVVRKSSELLLFIREMEATKS